MISLEAFSELLEVLYSVPLRQERWSHFLDLLCEHTGTMSNFLICANSRAQLSVQEQGGKAWNPQIIEAYAAKYALNDPYRLPLTKVGKTGVVECSDLLPNEVLWASDMYRHLNEPVGVKYPALMVLTLSLRRLELISFWRTPEQGPMDRDASRLLELLVPHVRSALDIRYALSVTETRAQGAEAMANASRTATFLLDGTGEVLHRNAAAASLLEERDGFAIHEGCLTAVQARMRVPLRNLLRAVSSPAEPGAGNCAAGKALSLERRAGKSPLQLLASPLPKSWRDGAACVLLLVTDPEKPVDVTDEMMREYFGLTKAETEVANGLLTGYSLEEVAALRRVTTGTTRIQMKSIFAKTGTDRQAELIRKLLGLPQMASAR